MCLCTGVNSSYNLWLGLTLALLSAFLIGGSVILKKKALLRLANTGHTRAGEQSLTTQQQEVSLLPEYESITTDYSLTVCVVVCVCR